MTFAQAIRHNIVQCLNFRARDPRSSYWWYFLFVMLGSLVTLILDFAIFWPATDRMAFFAENFRSMADFYVNVIPVTTFWYLLNYLPSLACGVRRMHDQDRPAWWFIATMVFVTAMSVVVFQVTGPQTADFMRAAFDPATTTAQFEQLLRDMEEPNRTSTILSGIQTLPSLLVIIWMASKGTAGPNRYGEDPLA